MLIRHYKIVSRPFLHCQRGLAYIELAIALPVLLILFFGVTEVARALLLTSTLEKTISAVTDVIATFDPTVTNAQQQFDAQLPQIMSALPDLMTPYSSANIYVRLTDFYLTSPGGTPTVRWTYTCGNQIAGPAASAMGGGVTIPGLAAPQQANCYDGSGMPSISDPMCQYDESLVGEAYYNFYPIIPNNGILGSFLMYKGGFNKPRNNFAGIPGSVLPVPTSSNCTAG